MNASNIPNNFALIRTLTAQLLDVLPAPFRIMIDHDVSPPKNVACPLPYDWRHGRTVGIATCDRPFAVRWIGRALMKGYRVERLDRTGYNVLSSADLKSARQRVEFAAKRAAMTPEQREEEDREIPF
jgi:hypothetical protein